VIVQVIIIVCLSHKYLPINKPPSLPEKVSFGECFMDLKAELTNRSIVETNHSQCDTC